MSAEPGGSRFGFAKRILLAIDRLLDRLTYSAGDLGPVRLSISPVTYYSPISSRRWLKENPQMWQRAVSLDAIDWDIESQFEWLEEVTRTHIDEVHADSLEEEIERRGIRFKYGVIEAEVLHCVVRSLAPGRVMELGSGASTAVMSDAAARNRAEGRGQTRIECVDPFASEALTHLDGVSVRPEYAQMLPVDAFAEMEAGDLLFIDSSHVVKTGSEMPRIYLEGIPALAAGVYVHIHDVYLPYLFRNDLFFDFWDFQESTLLVALLTGNPGIEVLASLSALHDDDPERLSALIPDFIPGERENGIAADPTAGHFPSSIWLRTR